MARLDYRGDLGQNKGKNGPPKRIQPYRVVRFILDDAGWYAREQGSYDKAEVMNQRALDGCNKVLGKEHPDTMTSVHSSARLLHRQQRYVIA